MVDLGALAGGDNHVCASGNKPAATGEVTRILRDWFGWRHVLDLGDITTARTVDVPGAVVRMLAAVGRRPSTSRSRPDRGGSPGGIPALARRLWPVLAVVLTETAWPRLSCAPGHLVVNTASDGAGRPCVAGYHPYIGGTAFKPGQLTGHTATASGRAKRCFGGAGPGGEGGGPDRQPRSSGFLRRRGLSGVPTASPPRWRAGLRRAVTAG